MTSSMTLWLLFAAALLIALAFFLARNGAFTRLTPVREEKVNPAVLVACIRNVGPYKDTGAIWNKRLIPAAKKLRGGDSKARNFVLSDDDTFGIYYDDPSKVSADRCRCILGIMLDTVEGKAEADLKEYWEKQLRAVGQEGMTLDIIPPMAGVTVNFPFRGIISILLSIMRVYPVLIKAGEEAAEEVKCPVGDKGILELYSINTSSSKFVFPLSPRDNFLAFEI